MTAHALIRRGPRTRGSSTRRTRRDARDHSILDHIRRLPAYGRLVAGLMTDERVSMLDKALVVAAIGYLASPLDLLGAPSFLPRFGRRRGRPALMFFAQAVDDIIDNRRALIESGAEAPRDLLTLLLSARDPESGRGMSDEDMRANILTFILAGHETTANALTWTLYLLSQSPEWRNRAEAEAEEVAITFLVRPLA